MGRAWTNSPPTSGSTFWTGRENCARPWRAENGCSLLEATLFVCDRLEDIGLVTPPEDLLPFSITSGPRVGIDYAEEAVDFPWRYQVAPESHLI